jgi:hypothetical protein
VKPIRKRMYSVKRDHLFWVSPHFPLSCSERMARIHTDGSVTIDVDALSPDDWRIAYQQN